MFGDPTLDEDLLEGTDVEIRKKIKEFFKEFCECFVVQWMELLSSSTEQGHIQMLDEEEYSQMKYYFFMLKWLLRAIIHEFEKGNKEMGRQTYNMNNPTQVKEEVGRLVKQLDELYVQDRKSLNKRVSFAGVTSMKDTMQYFYNEFNSMCVRVGGTGFVDAEGFSLLYKNRETKIQRIGPLTNHRTNLFGTARLAINEAASLLLEAAKHWNEFGGELADQEEGEIEEEQETLKGKKYAYAAKSKKEKLRR